MEELTKGSNCHYYGGDTTQLYQVGERPTRKGEHNNNDYSKFLDDDFDVKEWVNGAFNAQKEGNKDQYATTLVMKLQMFIQEVNHVIDECCQQTVTNLPRVMRELDAVKQEASLLREQMQIVKNDIEKVEQDTSQSMQTLLKLDLVKSRMNDASAALQEADNWTTLSADVDVVFESQDVHAIAEKLVGLQHSLEMLTDVPDYADRCQFLETLKNRLEAVLSPQVVAAFSAKSVESAQMYAQVFSDMGRLPQLTKYYHKCHKGHLLQSWRSVVQSGGTNDDNLPEQLSLFYDQLMAMWHSQIKWCTQVFTDPAPIVVDLLTEVLDDLDPSSSSLISRHIEREQRPVAALIQLKQFSERFAKSMESALETHSPSHLQLPSVQSLAVTIYAPYKPYIQKLGSFEESTLTAALNDIPLDHEEVFECTRLLADSVSKLFLAAKQANERCVQLSNGCGYVSLLEALQNYFLDYVREFRRVLTNVREKCRVDTSCMDAEDWSLFQNCLRIAQTSGDLILNTEEFQQQLLIDIVSCAEKYCPPTPTSPIASPTRGSGKKNPFHDYRLLLLDSDGDRATFDSLVTALEEGDMPSMPGDVKKEMYALSERVHKFAFDIVFAPLQQQLNLVSAMEVWVSETSGVAITANLPTFSLSPQEYITKIGQYLMTLPQQLDPFSLEDNPCLTAALRHSNLPYTSIQSESLESLADVWLESVARGTMHVYTEVILQIPQLTPHSTQQLITDIDYLVNVLDDLGLPSSDNIKDIVSLLKAPVASYQQTAEAAPRRLASVIAGMRSITLME